MRHRAAIIGCGRVAWMLEDDPLEAKPCTHMGAYEAFREAGAVAVVAAADRDEARLKAFAGRYGVDSVYLDYREMLKRERPGIVSVSAYATERSGMVMDSIEAGVKGIWCEKAFATSLREARMMTEACKIGGVSLIVSHLRRWSPDYRKAKEIIDSGLIGKLQYIACHFSGSLIHTGTHAFDVLLWFCGPAEWVSGELEGGGGGFLWEVGEDRGGRAVIKFRNGAYATIHGDSKNYFLFEFDIVGSSGRIRIGNNELLELYVEDKSRHYTGIRELRKEPFPEFDKKNIWVEALGNLIGCVEGSDIPADGPEDGLRALEAALAIHKSARSNGERVSLPIDDEDLSIRSR